MMLEQAIARATRGCSWRNWLGIGARCALRVRIQMHTQGMSVEEATRRFMEDAFMEETPARAEAVRGTFDPQYLNYTLGKLMLLKLREDHRAEQGATFDLKTFHDTLLSWGAPPLPYVRRLMLQHDDGRSYSGERRRHDTLGRDSHPANDGCDVPLLSEMDSNF
jgi:hypothetical protein